MNCDKAREILNGVLDGETHPLASEAARHAQECTACREWQAGMSEMCRIIDEGRDDLPVVDIVGAVMARLPDAHPASRHAAGVRYPRPVLAWLGASWLAGLVILSALGFALYGWMASWSVDRIVVGAIGYAKTAWAVLGIVARNALSLMELSMRLVADASPAILAFLAFDALFLVAVLMIFFGRRRVTRTSAMFC